MKNGTWFKEWLGIAMILIVFEVTWGLGIPSTNSLGLGATRLVFQIIFVVCSVLLGLVVFLTFVLLCSDARGMWSSGFNYIIPGRTGGFYTNQFRGGDIQENPYVSTSGALGMTELGAKPIADTDEDAERRGIASGATMTEKDNGDTYIANPATIDDDGEDEVAKTDISKEEADETDAKDTKL